MGVMHGVNTCSHSAKDMCCKASMIAQAVKVRKRWGIFQASTLATKSRKDSRCHCKDPGKLPGTDCFERLRTISCQLTDMMGRLYKRWWWCINTTMVLAPLVEGG